MIETINVFSINNLSLNWDSTYYIPVVFTNETLLIVSITTGNLRQFEMGFIAPYSLFGVTNEAELEYFWERVFIGNRLIKISPISDFYLKFKPKNTGVYSIRVDKILN